MTDSHSCVLFAISWPYLRPSLSRVCTCILHGLHRQLCARQSVLADRAVPETLGDIFGSTENVCSEGARSVLSALPEGYGPKEVHPWAVAQQQ